MSDPVDTLLNRRPDSCSYSRFEEFKNTGMISSLIWNQALQYLLKQFKTLEAWNIMKHALVSCMPLILCHLLVDIIEAPFDSSLRYWVGCLPDLSRFTRFTGFHANMPSFWKKVLKNLEICQILSHLGLQSVRAAKLKYANIFNLFLIQPWHQYDMHHATNITWHSEKSPWSAVSWNFPLYQIRCGSSAAIPNVEGTWTWWPQWFPCVRDKVHDLRTTYQL